MFFYPTNLIFCSLLQAEGSFARRKKNDSKYRDVDPLNEVGFNKTRYLFEPGV